MSAKIWTMGYAGRQPSELVRAVELLDAVVIDIRFKPVSRQAEWNKNALVKLLGRRYAHVVELGNVNYKGGPIQINDPTAGSMIVGKLLSEGRDVILLCVCRDYEKCHRKVVAEMLSNTHACPIDHIQHSLKLADPGLF